MASFCGQSLFLATLAILIAATTLKSNPKRLKKIPRNVEHVLIIGASSGVGRELAIKYALFGAQVCIVARDKISLDSTRLECNKASGRDNTIAIEADFSNPEDMVRVRETLQSKWGRLDTLAVIAGVSALKPLFETAGLERTNNLMNDTELENIHNTVIASDRALRGNFTGPLVAAVTFIPFMRRSSPSPSVLLLSSVAAVTPAPCRSLYCASKSASLLLYESLAIEHPDISFTCILPGTIEGDFRRSAVDLDLSKEGDRDVGQANKDGLRRDKVAARCIEAIDRQERSVFMAGFYRLVPTLYHIICPKFVEWAARRKYKYP